MPSEEEARLLEELRSLLPDSVSLESVLGDLVEAERRAGPEFADPRTWDEVAVLRLIEKHGMAVLPSPSLRRAIVRLIEERRHTTSPRRQNAIDPALRALVRTLIPRRQPRVASTLDATRADRVSQVRRISGMTRTEAIEQVARDEPAMPEAVQQSLKRHSARVKRASSREPESQ